MGSPFEIALGAVITVDLHIIVGQVAAVSFGGNLPHMQVDEDLNVVLVEDFGGLLL